MTNPAAHEANAITAATRSVVVAAAVVVVLAGFLVPLPSYGADARTLPLVVGVPALVLGIASLIREAHKLRVLQQGAGKTETTAPTTDESSAPPRASVAVAMAWISAGAGLIVAFGFLIGAAVFIPAFMRFYGRESVLRIALVTAGVVGVVYVMFIWLLNVPYHPGLWG